MKCVWEEERECKCMCACIFRRGYWMSLQWKSFGYIHCWHLLVLHQETPWWELKEGGWQSLKLFIRIRELCCILLLFSYVWLFETPWTSARQAPLSCTVSQSLLKFVSIESVMLSSQLILCLLLLHLLSIFPSIRVFSSESALRIRWPKYWSVSFSISPSSE